MRKVLKYLKPFTLLIIAVAVLLLIQAVTELALPNYMSDIVDVGIQQGGITDAAPAALSERAYNLMLTGMTESEKELIKSNYKSETVKPDAELARTYPAVAGKTIYVRVNSDPETLTKLNRAFSMAAVTLVHELKEYDGASLSVGTEGASRVFNLSLLYKNELRLKDLTTEQIEKARNTAAESGADTSETTGDQFARAFIDELGGDPAKIQSDYIAKAGGRMIIIAAVSCAASVAVGFLASRIAAGAARDIRRDVFSKVEYFSLKEFHKFSTASLITRTTNDITQIQMLFVMGIRMLLFAPIMGIGGVIMAFQKSVSMAWLIGAAILVIIGILAVVVSLAMPKFKIMQKLIDKINLTARESLTGIMVVRAFGRQQYEESRFEKANHNLASTQLFTNRVMVSMMPLLMLVMNGLSLLIIWIGAGQIQNSSLEVGDMMAYIQYSMIIIMSFLMVAMMFIMIPRAQVSASRISEILDTEISVKNPKDPKPLNLSDRGLVDFKDVSFKYEGAEHNVLSDITFTAKPGETTAIIGPTGSGKTTLINLIPRFYDATDGVVSVDGVNVKEASQTQLRDQIGYVPQKGMLFSGTIESNIKYGAPDISEEQVRKAAEISQSLEFIDEKPEGFLSPVSEGGSNVSGGQRQRLSIARALAKNPAIYIFDDTFSALDAKTDAELRKALKKYTAGATVIIVAQRVSTILHADQIIVLDEGRIVGKGTHGQLIKDCPQYIEIVESQLGGML